jgi:TonB-dependent SusC/RagA subfamily outer membrane receptor
MKKFLLFSTLSLCLHFRTFAQSDNYELNVVDKLKNYFSMYDPEKAYLQFDRPYYAAGDTIYFKAYLTRGGHHELSYLSGVLHVDFINTKNNIEQSIKLQLDSGICWGDFALPDSLLPGNYRIRAYTQWMLNQGETHFFYQNISIGSFTKRIVSDPFAKQDQHLKREKADLQFFPEGGTLVEGVESKVAFKAIGTNGLAIYVKGVLLDKDEKQVCSFESSHLGMGYFIFHPEKDNAYKARLSFADGSQNIVDLPKAEVFGISLSVTTDSISKISIGIIANESYYKINRNRDFLMLLYSGGKTISYPYKLDDTTIFFDLEKKLFQTGVTTVTLFSQDGEPLCERLFFVQNDDQLNLQMHTDKTSYGKKDKVNLSLNAENKTGSPADGHFSVTVFNETNIPENENNERNILTSLLLTSDLAGFVEQPNYYFMDTSVQTRNDLDVLMLTQGYRDFEWRQVLSNEPKVLNFLPERGLEINGKITNLSNKPISNGTVTLVPSKGGSLLSSTSDSKGLFRFTNLVFTDTTHLVLSAVNSKGSNWTKITYLNTNNDSPMVAANLYVTQRTNDSSLNTYVEKEKATHDEYIKHIPFRGQVLKEVTVKAVMEDNHYRTQSLAGAGFADQVMHADEIQQIGGNLTTSLNGRLRGVNFTGEGVPFLTSSLTTTHGFAPMLLILDGQEIKLGSQFFSIDDIPSTQIETIEVLRFASASIYGMDGANGVLIITTKDGSEKKDIAAVGVLPIAPMGFYKARTFYSPKYDYTSGNPASPEMRPTIYWNPEIKTDVYGNAFLEYYNAEMVGTYKVVVEGIDKNGNIGRQVYRYKVE